MEIQVTETEKFIPEQVILNALEKIKKHFSKPDAQLSMVEQKDGGKKCKYRLDETPECSIRCGIGVLIPDDKYDPLMEGISATTDMVHDNKVSIWAVMQELGFESYISRRMVNHIQQTHDSSNNVEDFLERLEDLKQLYLSGQFDY